MRGNFLYAVTIGLCSGVAAALLFAWGAAVAFGLLTFSAVCLVGSKLDKRLLLAAAACAAAALGLIRVDFFLRAEAQDTVAEFTGHELVIEGKVVADPDKRDTSLRLTVAVNTVDGTKERGTLLAVVDRETVVAYGDRVTLNGDLSLPEAFETSAGRVFDYPSYLRVRGVSAMMHYAQVERVEPGGPSLARVLFAAKHAFEYSLERAFPEPDVSLLEGVLIGERRGLPQGLTQAFTISGLIHVVVLSGYNISIVSEAVLRALSFLPSSASYPLGGVGIVLFAVLTGGGATTVRASIMGLIAIFARYLHRESVALRALAVAATGMVLYNPLALFFDPSFVLSVLATFGLITLSPVVEKHLPKFLKKFPSLASIAASTIAVQIYILPALLYFTGMLSFLALPANLLVLPMVPLVMLLGFVTGLLGFVHPALAFVAALPADFLLHWMLLVAQTTAAVPFASTTVPALPAWLVAVVYVPLTVFAISVYRRNVSRPHSN